MTTSPHSIAPAVILLIAALGFQRGVIASDTPLPTLQKNQQPKMNKRMTPELLWQLGRLGDVAVSPDRSQIAYTVRTFELEKNSGLTDLHIVDLISGNDKTVIQGWASIGALQ